MLLVRESIIGLMGCIAFILMCSEPANEETWYQTFFITKGIAFLLGYATYRLCVYWESKGFLPNMEE